VTLNRAWNIFLADASQVVQSDLFLLGQKNDFEWTNMHLKSASPHPPQHDA